MARASTGLGRASLGLTMALAAIGSSSTMVAAQSTQTVTYAYTGAAQTWTVASRRQQRLRFDVYEAQGGQRGRDSELLGSGRSRRPDNSHTACDSGPGRPGERRRSRGQWQLGRLFDRVPHEGIVWWLQWRRHLRPGRHLRSGRPGWRRRRRIRPSVWRIQPGRAGGGGRRWRRQRIQSLGPRCRRWFKRHGACGCPSLYPAGVFPGWSHPSPPVEAGRKLLAA